MNKLFGVLMGTLLANILICDAYMEMRAFSEVNQRYCSKIETTNRD